MKSKCLLLVKNRLIKQSGINVIRYDTDKRRRRNKRVTLVAMLILLLMVLVYSGGYAYGLCMVGAEGLIPAYSFFICGVIALVFTVFKTPGELFGYGDFDFLMSIPVKASTIIASRFMTLYLENTFLTIFVMVPMGIVYGVFVRPGVVFYLMWLIGMLINSFIPTTISVIVGALITLVSSRFKRSNVAGTIVTIVITCLVIILPFGLLGSRYVNQDGTFNISKITGLVKQASEMIYQIYPPARWFARSVLESNVFMFAKLILISGGWYILFVWILSLRYKTINTAVSTHYTTADYKVADLKQSSILGTLYKKELRRWAGSTIYLINTIMGGLWQY